MFDYRNETNRYVVHFDVCGKEFITFFNTIDKVADFVEKDKNVTGVWYMMSCKLPEGVYTRKK